MKKSKGVALPVAILVILILCVIGFAIVVISVGNLDVVSNFRDSVSAYYAARSGVSRAIKEIYDNPGWISGFSEKSLASACGTFTVTFDKTKSYYSINNLNGSSTVTGWGGIAVPVGYCHIVSTGKVNKSIQRVGVLAKAISFSPLYPWRFAAFGDISISLGNNTYSDSYDTSASPPTYTLLNEGADIGTNGISSGSATLFDGSMVYGDVYVGVGGSTSTSINPQEGAGCITNGSAQVLTAQVLMPSVIDPVSGAIGSDISYSGSGDEGTLPPGKYDSFSALSVDDSTVTFRSGEYSFTSFEVSGNSCLNIDASAGPVKIYVSGPISITGKSITNYTTIAGNFQIFGTDLCTSVLVSGHSNSYYAVYTPNADISIVGTSTIWGSIVGKTVTVGGTAQLHYDKALYNRPGPPVRSGYLEVTTWQNVY